MLPIWFTFKLTLQHRVNGNMYYLLQNNLYLLRSGCQYLTSLSWEVQTSQTFSKFMGLLRELKMVFQTERLFFTSMLKGFKSSVSNSTLGAKIKCSKWLVKIHIHDRRICKSYRKCLGFRNRTFMPQLRMQNISQLTNHLNYQSILIFIIIFRQFELARKNRLLKWEGVTFKILFEKQVSLTDLFFQCIYLHIPSLKTFCLWEEYCKSGVEWNIF